MKTFEKDSFKDITLLYVEDDEMTLEEISFFLKKYVKELIVAKNGEEGLELFKQHNPDMVITDIQMPIMNGLEMSKKILQINPSVPIAVTTAYSDSQYLINAIEIGIDKYLLKPINMMDVLTVIHKSLQLNFIDMKIHQEYIQFILDENPTFMLIMNSNKIEYINKNLLTLLGYDDLNSFNEKTLDCKELFEFNDLKVKDNYIDYIVKHPNDKFLVTLKNVNSEIYYDRKFYISYKYFENINKSIFLFIEEKNSKVDKIDEILEDLKQNIKDSVLVDKINKIYQLNK